jgi:hypothetical protein
MLYISLKLTFSAKNWRYNILNVRSSKLSVRHVGLFDISIVPCNALHVRNFVEEVFPCILSAFTSCIYVYTCSLFNRQVCIFFTTTAGLLRIHSNSSIFRKRQVKLPNYWKFLYPHLRMSNTKFFLYVLCFFSKELRL